MEDISCPLPAYGWMPREDQMPLWSYLEGGGLRAVEVAHRRWGKDEVALHFTACASQQRIGGYWHMLPQFNQCRKAVWDAINPRTGRKRIDDAFPEEIRAHTRNTDMFIEFVNGSTWQLVGSDNYNSLVGSPPVGLVLSEYALADPQCWAYLSPILEENGGWAAFISTSRGNNHLKRILDFARVTKGWFNQVLTANDTPVFNERQLLQIRDDLIGAFGLELGEAMFEQEYMCSFQGAVIGAYYGKQMAVARKEGRITSVPYETGLEVYTFWDLGIDDSMTIWFMQFNGMETRVIDYYENSGMGLAHYAKVLKAKPYVYGDHYMPHDAAVREMSAGERAKSREEVARELGIRPIVIVPRPRNIDAVMTGIEGVRNALGSCWFDAVKCVQGVSALEGYKSEYDESKKVMTNKPLHDWCSHGADAFRTFAVGYKSKRKPKSGTRRVLSGWAA